MANITAELAAIMAAVYGEEVRGSIHDAIEKINTASEKAIASGTAFAPGDLATGYPSGSLYLNLSTNKLLRSNGSTWDDAGSTKGNGIVSIEKTDTTGLVDTYTITYDDASTEIFEVTNGNGIASIVKVSTVGLVDTYQITYSDGTSTTYEVTNGNGIASIAKTSTAGLVDTYTITYDDGTTSTFDVTNGVVGNKWYRGSVISGKSINPTKFPSSGITEAQLNDFYLNPVEGAVYHCHEAGGPTVATWVYDFTMQGGGSGGASSWGDLTDKPFAFVDTDDNLQITGSGESKHLKLNIPNKKNTYNATDDTFDDVLAAADEGDFIINEDEEGGGGGASTWNDISGKPFNTLGEEFEVVSNVLKIAELPNGNKRYMIGTLTAGHNMLGEWQTGPESSWRKKDDYGRDTFVFSEAFYEDADEGEVISLHFMFDSKTNQPIYIAGFQWWNDESTQKGGLNCMLANTPDSDVDIWVEVMRTVES